MVKINWTEISTIDLKEIFDYISEDSVHYASLTVSKIHQKAQTIIDNPRIGKVVPEIKDMAIRELIEGKYRIIYRLKSEDMVDILRVYHSSRLLKRTNIKLT
jgi:addiction module RelE/StbE family toxin